MMHQYIFAPRVEEAAVCPDELSPEEQHTANGLAQLEGLWWDCDPGPGSGPGYGYLMLVPGGFVILTSGMASGAGGLAQTFVPCSRDDAVRLMRRRSKRFAEAVESAGAAM